MKQKLSKMQCAKLNFKYKTKKSLSAFCFDGDLEGNRTPNSAVKGRCINLFTTRPEKYCW